MRGLPQKVIIRRELKLSDDKERGGAESSKSRSETKPITPLRHGAGQASLSVLSDPLTPPQTMAVVGEESSAGGEDRVERSLSESSADWQSISIPADRSAEFQRIVSDTHLPRQTRTAPTTVPYSSKAVEERKPKPSSLTPTSSPFVFGHSYDTLRVQVPEMQLTGGELRADPCKDKDKESHGDKDKNKDKGTVPEQTRSTRSLSGLRTEIRQEEEQEEIGGELGSTKSVPTLTESQQTMAVVRMQSARPVSPISSNAVLPNLFPAKSMPAERVHSSPSQSNTTVRQVVSPVEKSKFSIPFGGWKRTGEAGETEANSPSRDSETDRRVHPSFVYLQLQQIPFTNEETVTLKAADGLSRSLRVLDYVLPYDTHKIGVIYVGPGQSTEEEFLMNRYGSPDYTNFLRGLGKFVRLKGCSEDLYTGGLDVHNGADGEYTLMWRDALTQMLFHVTTLMPVGTNSAEATKQSVNQKKRHIGNDYVSIVYSTNTTPFDRRSLRGQFHYVLIVIYPLGNDMYMVDVKKKPVLPKFGPLCPGMKHLVYESHLAALVRETAMNANTAAMAMGGKLHTDNWVARLSHIRQVVKRFGTASSGKDFS